MKKYLLLFLVTAALSYLFFSTLNKYEPQPEPLPPMPDTTIQATPVLPTPADTTVQQADSTIYALQDGVYNITWQQLSKVQYTEIYNDSVGMFVAYPEFHPDIWFLDGKEVRIEGYVIPIEETGDADILVLSAFPFTNCFFCGNAGPESVMDIKLQKSAAKRYKRDTKTTFKGRLRLNDSDLYYLNYILENAVEH